jgi:hypothetical protein
MARGAYLERLARRAVQATPGLMPPRRLVRALPATAPDPPLAPARAPSAASLGPDADSIPRPAPMPIAAPPARVEPQTRSEPTIPAAIALSPPLADAGVVPGLGGSVDPIDAPTPIAAPDTPPAEKVQPQPADPLIVATAPRMERKATAPLEPRRSMPPDRNIAVAPDPLAVALATAVRWASSDEDRPAPIAANGPERARPATTSAKPGRAVPAPTAPEADQRSRVGLAPPAGGIAAAPDGRRSAAAPERFAGIHIGSVEVQILSPPPPSPPPVARTPAASSAGPVKPLARGLTSAIGLRQS